MLKFNPKFFYKFIQLILIISSFGFSQANAACDLKLDQISKWEILAENKLLAYDRNARYLAFVNFYGYPLPRDRSMPTFRFFSPSICAGDDVQINGSMAKISDVKMVRSD